MTGGEEVGKVANATLASLQGNPLCISLLVLVAIITTFSYFKTVSAIEARSEAIVALIAKCQTGAP